MREGNRPAGSRVLIPLVKTAAGDRDYAVVLKYGGKMDRPGWAAAVRFPLVHTKNIHVERSVVKLCLPESDCWFDFGGTMRLAEQEADVAAQEFFYQNWQLSQLAQVASKSDRFAQARAAANIKALGMEMQKFRAEKRAGIVGNRAMDKAVQANAEAMGQALQQVEQMEKAATRGQPVSRESLNRLFANQRQSRSYNVVNGPGVNFEASPNRSAHVKNGVGGFAVEDQNVDARCGVGPHFRVGSADWKLWR